MSIKAHRVVTSFLNKIAMPNIQEGDMSKLVSIQTELTDLVDKIKPIKKWDERNKASQSDSERKETEKELEELEAQIKKKSEEYARHMHKMYPRSPLKECYPNLDY
jgi:peptidoglycan hydrolase CwlO-like protein